MLDDLLACVAASRWCLEGAFDPHRFLDEFSARAQALVPHEGMLIACVEDADTFSIFARHVEGAGVPLDYGNYTIALEPAGRLPRVTAGIGPVLDGEEQRINDVQTYAQRGDPAVLRAWCEATGFGARVGVPLYPGGRVVGAFFAASVAPGRFTDAHVRVCRLIADLIGPFVENVVLLQRERRRRERLAALANLTSILSESLRLGDVITRLGDAVRPILDFDGLEIGRASLGKECRSRWSPYH